MIEKIFNRFKKKEKLPLTEEQIFNKFKFAIDKVFEYREYDKLDYIEIEIEDRFDIRSCFIYGSKNFEIAVSIADFKNGFSYQNYISRISSDDVINLFFKDYIRDQKINELLK